MGPPCRSDVWAVGTGGRGWLAQHGTWTRWARRRAQVCPFASYSMPVKLFVVTLIGRTLPAIDDPLWLPSAAVAGVVGVAEPGGGGDLLSSVTQHHQGDGPASSLGRGHRAVCGGGLFEFDPEKHFLWTAHL